ncbi:MAG TPA: MFS transporter [Burkholderiales bacterium]|nr:MFS transporter [Burkholderiales bacterium]
MQNGGHHSRLGDSWLLIAVLGATEIISYGSVFYSFSLLMEPLQAALGASRGTVVGAFSVALAVAGLCAMRIGSTIDRIGGRTVMALGSAASALLLVALSRVETVAGLYGLYAGLGVAMAATLYDPAFAVLARHFRAGARAAITALTLIAGFSSTVFWPLTQALISHFGWREAVFLLGMLNLLVCAPLHFAFLPGRGSEAPAAHDGGQAAPASRSMREVLREPAFYFLGGCFAVQGLVFSAMSVHMPSMMQSKGLSAPTAVLVAALVGPMQVLGRILELTAGRRWPIAHVGLLAMAGLVAALAVFACSGGHAWPLVAFAALYGMSNGVATIVRGTLPATMFGHRHYGAISGALAAPQMFALAAGPFVVSLLWMATGGYDPVLIALSGAAAAGLASLYAAHAAGRRLGQDGSGRT